MNNRPTHTPLTLEDIARPKAELLQQIRQRQQAMRELGKQLTVPLEPAANKAGAIARAFHTGMAVFDGIKLGLKLMRSFRKTFRKR